MNDGVVSNLKGPILVLGASGFVGAALFKRILAVRNDVYGSAQRLPAWRLGAVPVDRIVTGDLLTSTKLAEIMDHVNPKTVFNCLAYGGYSFQEDADLIYRTNFLLTTEILQLLEPRDISAYVSCGSSSEYGRNCEAPGEDAVLEPNSHYSVSKCAISHLLRYYGKTRRMPVANLRLYSVYGPGEDAARLIPALVRKAADKELPPFVSPDVSRDFVYVDDVCTALLAAATRMGPRLFGESLNIGSGRLTTMRDLAAVAKSTFAIEAEPQFNTMANRRWDERRWVANPAKAAEFLGWHAKTPLETGLRSTYDWYKTLPDPATYLKVSKSQRPDRRSSVSAVVACHKDAQAIPIMWQRLSDVFQRLDVDYEIIFVNDGSPDDSERVILEISAKDRRTIGITHARNFGSQAAFRSGMTAARKASCVLLDGDLQDPPELIEAFVAKWREGYDVVYGRRVRREATWFMNLCYKGFYRAFNQLSYVAVPKDAGDFSLIDRQVMDWLLKFPERDLFMRGLRAYVGFAQTGVDYVRPERQFGRSTNNLWRNIGWAKKGILSFSHVPLNALSAFSFVMVLLSLFLVCLQILVRAVWPNATPAGLTTVIIGVIGIGSLNLLGLSIIGEYVAKIFEEVKRRPHYIRKGIIQDGEIRTEAPR